MIRRMTIWVGYASFWLRFLAHLFPPSRLTPWIEGEVARLRGELETARQTPHAWSPTPTLDQLLAVRAVIERRERERGLR